MNQHAPQLVWDLSRFQTDYADVTIAVAPDDLPPFSIDAVVEEQDTALVLGDLGEVRDPGPQASWFFANKLESQTLVQPGGVLIRPGNPKRMLAIVHDLDKDPSWRAEWIAQALGNMLALAEPSGINAIALPILGAKHGRISAERFIAILLDVLRHSREHSVRNIWLRAPARDCEYLYELLRDA